MGQFKLLDTCLMRNVQTLDSTTFRSFVGSNSNVLLALVVLPMSKPCQRFLPEFQLVSEHFHNAAPSNLAFTQVDFLKNNDVTHELVLPFPEFPHVVLLEDGKVAARYHGVLYASWMDFWLNVFFANSRISEITSTSSLSDFEMRAGSAAVIAFIDENDDVTRAKITELADEIHPEFVFGICTDLSLAQQHGKNHDIDIAVSSIVFTSRGRVGSAKIPPGAQKVHLAALLRRADMFPVDNFFLELHDDYLEGIPLGYIFIDNEKEREDIRSSLEPIAERLAGKIQLGIANSNHFEDIIGDLHLNTTQLPSFAIREPTSNLRYPMAPSNDPFPTAVASFIQSYLSDNPPRPTIKSEPIPPPSDSALIKVVGLTYNSIVLNPTKDVLVMYTMTPCAPCVALFPILQQLAELYQSDEVLKGQVTIAWIAYDENDVPGRDIRAFPTLRLFCADGEVVEYTGGRTVEELASFIGRHGSNKAMLEMARVSRMERAVLEE